MSISKPNASSTINTFNEKPLHAALKQWYAQPGDEVEVPLEGYMIDLVQRNRLVEIQTRNFSAIRKKLTKLVEKHQVCLVHPIAQQKWIVKLKADGVSELSRRKSPKQGCLEHIFVELVNLPHLLDHPNFRLEVLLTHEEEVRHYVGRKAAWRKKGWQTQERRLLKVVAQHHFNTFADLGKLIPTTLADSFTTTDLGIALGQPKWLAQRMAYCLREAKLIEATGKRGRSVLYTYKR